MQYEWRESKKGNFFISSRGYLVTVFRAKDRRTGALNGRFSWVINNEDKDFNEFSAGSFDDLNNAKDDAIDRLEELIAKDRAQGTIQRTAAETFDTDIKDTNIFDSTPVFDENGNVIG